MSDEIVTASMIVKRQQMARTLVRSAQDSWAARVMWYYIKHSIPKNIRSDMHDLIFSDSSETRT